MNDQWKTITRSDESEPSLRLVRQEALLPVAGSLPVLPPHRVESSYIAGTSARWWQVYLKEPLPNGSVAIGQKGDTIKQARHLARAALAAYYTRENTQPSGQRSASATSSTT